MRRYTVAEVEWLADVLAQGDVGREQVRGMRSLVRALRHFEHMTDAEIEAWTEAEIAADRPRGTGA